MDIEPSKCVVIRLGDDFGIRLTDEIITKLDLHDGDEVDLIPDSAWTEGDGPRRFMIELFPGRSDEGY
jgi:hypothetical protein